LNLVGEMFEGYMHPSIKDYLKRQMKRGEDPYYAVRPSQFAGALLKETGINHFSNVYYGKDKVDPDKVYQYEHHDRDGCLSKDRRIFYNNPKYPWIMGIQIYWQCANDPFHADFSWFSFPAGTAPGRYLIHYRWRGFYDCVDVEVTSEHQEYPWGTNFGRFPPQNSIYKDLKVPPLPGSQPTPPPTPMPTPVPPTPMPVVPRVDGKLTAWYKCNGATSPSPTSSDPTLNTPPTPSGTMSAGARVACGVKMISSLWMSELRAGDWSEIGSGVTVSSGGTTALDHGLLVVQSAGALDWHRAEVNRLFPITANTEYTAELWYYAETGTKIFITMDIDEKVEAYVLGRRADVSSWGSGGTGFSNITPLLSETFGNTNRHRVRLRFTPDRAGGLRFGFGPGEPGVNFYWIATGIALNAGDGDALIHSRFNTITGQYYAKGAVSDAIVGNKKDANGAGNFIVQNDGGILFDDSPRVKSPKTNIALSGDTYLDVQFTTPFDSNAPAPASTTAAPAVSDSVELNDHSGYYRHATLIAARVATNAAGKGCFRQTSSNELAELGYWDLYGSSVGISLWFVAKNNGGVGPLIHKEGGAWSIVLLSGNQIAAKLTTKSGSATVTASVSQWTTSKFNHVAFIYDNQTLSLYYNGAVIGSKTLSGDIVSVSGMVRLGGDGASVFDGGVREVRVYQSIVDMNDVYKQDTSMPGGARARDQFARVDHCAHLPQHYELLGECRRLDGKDPNICFAECAAMGVDECHGVDVMPLLHSAPVYEEFRDELNLPDHPSCTLQALTKNKPATKDSYGCFAFKLAVGKKFFTVQDVEDPAFFGSCYARVPVFGDEQPAPLGDVQTEHVYADGCVSCDVKQRNANNNVLPEWPLENVCVEHCQ